MKENRCIFCDTIIPQGYRGYCNYEHNDIYKTPSEEQIKLADEIAQILHIDFPCTSEDFTEEIYTKFINNNAIKFAISGIEHEAVVGIDSAKYNKELTIDNTECKEE